MLAYDHPDLMSMLDSLTTDSDAVGPQHLRAGGSGGGPGGGGPGPTFASTTGSALTTTGFGGVVSTSLFGIASALGATAAPSDEPEKSFTSVIRSGTAVSCPDVGSWSPVDSTSGSAIVAAA
ncbi:unnamed protein product [Phytophthora lilii]|uniref:Unnamed protein product n=1 Tax=Phytophthora lilii TaxID=2077276 RepID=A0A9W6TBJ2_9STRA|nr:unnamed protein product [Phytophthora lilii]